ncbi:amino acid ABC transporter ATP-binding protein [Merdimonas faecis]|uniref:amino acid ABC transporter ATP-binding protein n=1 Tax=Merdimonas faecis TaxID=1653435 RepID=UPI0023F6723C|nr:amino acid ABC transporter ATP-binding protein [Merdimonas faecis]
MLEVKKLNKFFGDNHVLKDIDLQFESHKTTVIIGSSGSGKSTLLRCINQLETPDSGEISWNGMTLDFSKKVPKSQSQAFTKLTGMVFQSFNLFPHRTALGNIIEAPMTVLKKSRKEAEEEAMELLRKVGLEDKRDSYPHQLSGGQQQRIAIARALAMKPEILLFDEPTSALDPELEADVLNLIRELAEEKYTILVVTHNMGFARDVSDEVVFVNHGTILAKGSYDELSSSDNERIKQFLSFF